MKTYIYKAVAGVCSLMLLMSSCESFLSEEPKDFLSPENLPNTEAECNMLLMGSLSYWRSNNFERHINFIAEATTDAVVRLIWRLKRAKSRWMLLSVLQPIMWLAMK